MKIEHVGWITRNIKLFESFWCDILDFEIFFESELDSKMAQTLFGLNLSGKIVRYRREDMIIEIHLLSDIQPSTQDFNRFGINHICLHVEDREALLSTLDKSVPVHRYNNPRGWSNIFIQDFENNWIELRETF
jgi:catechol 2,3-dioxygenase-like lactoylglutathione lyase family enzyme